MLETQTWELMVVKAPGMHETSQGWEYCEMRRGLGTEFPGWREERLEMSLRRWQEHPEEMEKNPKGVGPWRLREGAVANVAERVANAREENFPLDLEIVTVVIAMAVGL